MKIQAGLFAFVIGGCTGAVAPESNMPAAAEATAEQAPLDALGGEQAPEGGEAGAFGEEGVDGELAGGEEGDGAEQSSAEESSPLGTITKKDGDLEFEPVSVYAQVADQGGMMFRFVLTEDRNVNDKYFKSIKEWECVDPVEPEEEDLQTPKQMWVMIGNPPTGGDDRVDGDGFPTMDEYEYDKMVMGTFMAGGESVKVGNDEGEDWVKFETRPAKVGEAFKATLTLKTESDFVKQDFSEADATYVVEVEGEVVKSPEHAPAPECDGDQVPSPKSYED